MAARRRPSRAKPVRSFSLSADDLASVANTPELRDLMVQKARRVVALAKAEFEAQEVEPGVRPEERHRGHPTYPDVYEIEVVRSLDGIDRLTGPRAKLPAVRVHAKGYTSHWLERRGTYGGSRIDYQTLRSAIDKLDLG